MPLVSLILCANEPMVRVLTSILRDLDVQVEACADATAALSQLKVKPFNAIIIDWQEEAVALGLLQAVRRSALNQATLVIAVLDNHCSPQSVFTRGVNFVLYKPISPERARSSLQTAHQLMQRERRQGPRLPVHIATSISYADVEGTLVTLLDLSQAGTSLQSEGKLPASGKVYFHFQLPGRTPPIRLSGQVVWQDSTGRFGIRFVDVPQASRRDLQEWLQVTQAQQRSAPQLPPVVREAVKTPRSAAPPAASPKKVEARGAPLPRASSRDRRGESRHTCELGAQVYRAGLSVPHWCKLTDLSTGGCYIETTSPFPPKTPVEVVVRTQDLKLRTHGTVQVVHPGFGMGIEFGATTEDQKKQIQGLIHLLYAGVAPEEGQFGQAKPRPTERRRNRDAAAAGSDT